MTEMTKKSGVILQAKIGDNVYELHCSEKAALGELHDALMEIKGFAIEKMIANHKAEQEAMEAQKVQESQECVVEA